MTDIDAVDLRGTDLNLLVVFDALLRERSVSRAAVALRMSQSAASAALGRLRRLFGDPLFVRTATGIAPTTRATELAASIQPALAMVRDAVVQGPVFDPAAARRTFTVGMSDDLEPALLPRLLETVAPHPGLRVVALQTNSSVVGDAVDRGEVDVAVVAGGHRPTTQRSVPLFRSGYRCIYNPRILPLPDPLTLDAFVGTPHLLIAHGGRRGIVDDLLEARGLERRAPLATTHFGGAAALIAATPLLATMPSHAAAAYARLLDLRVVPPPIEMPDYPIVLVWRATTAEDPALAWFRDRIVDAGAAVGEELAAVGVSSGPPPPRPRRTSR